MSKQAEILDGMKAISNFLGRSESTVLRMIRSEELDRRKIIWKRGGVWVANKSRLDKWWYEGEALDNW